MDSGIFGLPRKTTLWSIDQAFLTRATPGTTTGGGVLNVGNGVFDGISAGTHAGSSSGTIIAVNVDSSFSGGLLDLSLNGATRHRFYPGRYLLNIVPTSVSNQAAIQIGNQNQFNSSSAGTAIGIDLSSGYTGNLVDFQLAGVSKFKIDNAGYVSTAGGITTGTLTPPGGLAAAIGTTGVGAALVANTTYFYALTAVDYEGNETGTSASVTFVEDVTTPTKVNLSWTAAASIAKFVNIYKGTTNNVANLNFLAQVSGATTSYIDDGNTNTTGTLPPTSSITGTISLTTTGRSVTTTTATSPKSITITNSNGGGTIGIGVVVVAGNGGLGIAVTDRLMLWSSSPIFLTSGSNGGSLQVANPSGTTMTLTTGGSNSILQISSGTSTVQFPASGSASANFGLVNIGPSGFAGGGGANFVGSSSGTVLAINAAGSYAGNLADLQVAGVSKFLVDSKGMLNDACGQGSAARLEAYRLYS